MSIRPFKLPQDIDLMTSLVVDGFQYPENPAWGVQADEKQVMIDRINGAKKIWPLLRLMQIVSPVFRDALCGFIDEEENRPAGLINYMRQRNEPEWYIANVTVLPAYRRRGIARKLVEATLEELSRRKAQVALLDVVEGNDPAFKLYQELGFEAYTKSIEYVYQNDQPLPPASLPDGYFLKSRGDFDWRTGFEFSKRITPEHVKQYEPVTSGRFRPPLVMVLFGILFESMGGSASERFTIQNSSREVVGLGEYSFRIREGGVNRASLQIDPAHPGLAEAVLCYMVSKIQKASPGRRIELDLEDWQTAMVRAAEALGFEKRYSQDRMGLRFSENGISPGRAVKRP